MPLPITDINQLDMNATYTAADYLSWQFDELVQLVRGKIVRMSPAPRLAHARISSQLERALYKQLASTGPCQVFHAPVDVYLPTKDASKPTIVQPDVFIVCDAGKLQEHGCVGAPEWVCEILSPSSLKLDRLTKKGLYEEAGVKEYTLIYPQERFVEVYTLSASGKYTEPVLYSTKGESWELTSVSGVWLTYAELFGEE